ncbi:MAG: hypothetical protein ACTSYS_14395 [Promethearchaeota archaeon]
MNEMIQLRNSTILYIIIIGVSLMLLNSTYSFLISTSIASSNIILDAIGNACFWIGLVLIISFVILFLFELDLT